MPSHPEFSLIDYPSDFPIKVIGPQQPEFAQTITEIVQRFDPEFDPAKVKIRPSQAGKYVGLTFTIRATSRQQLDDLYRTLHRHPLVKTLL